MPGVMVQPYKLVPIVVRPFSEESVGGRLSRRDPSGNGERRSTPIINPFL
jgi:hypothetical protein